MHRFNVLNKSTSNESIKNDNQNDNTKENNPHLTTTASSSLSSMNAEKSPLSITSHSSIQHDRQELYHQYGSSSTDCAINAKKPPQHQTVTFSSEINLANQAKCSVLQVLQAGSKPVTKTIKPTDLNRPHLQLNFAHSFRHPVSGSLDETNTGTPTNVGHFSGLSTVHVVNRGSTFLSSKSPPNQHHHTLLHQLPAQTSSFNQSNIYNQNVLFNQTSSYGTGNQTSQLASPSYRTINLNAAPTSGLSANDIYRGRRCFKRSISLASAQPHHPLNQQMSLTQPYGGGGPHRRTLLADYGRRRAYLDSFE